MTIAERINLHKCGYSRAEIEELAAAEKAELETIVAEEVTPAQTVTDPTPEQPATDPTPAQPVPEGNDSVLNAIKELTKAIYAQNIHRAEQPAPNQVTMDDLVNKI